MKKYIAILVIILLFIYSCKNNTSEKSLINYSPPFIDSLYSISLSEYRSHTLYLPPDFKDDQEYSIIYATDGPRENGIERYKNLFDSLISNEITHPFIYAASHSNHKIADSTSTTLGNGDKVYLNYRNFEYVENQYTPSIHSEKLANRFTNHLIYFKDEFIPYIENQFSNSIPKERRLFYGFSNGGGFGLNLLNKEPDLIGNYICFSPMGGNIDYNHWDSSTIYPDLYFKHGNKENFVLATVSDTLMHKYEASNSFYEYEVYNGGHDSEIWFEKFGQTISKILTTSKSK